MSSLQNLSTFHKLWTALPADRSDRNFWSSLESLWESFLCDDKSPFQNSDFFALHGIERDVQNSIPSISSEVLETCSASRVLFDAFCLWNPCALSSFLQVPICTVIEQLLLAVERKWLELRFVVCCVSCAHDIMHFSRVWEINFSGMSCESTFRCPMCTDYAKVRSLNDIYVFFKLKNLSPVFQREHYRLFCSRVAEKQRLESIYCPAGANFAMTLQFPKGRYLLAAPFIAALLELNVECGCEDLPSKEPFVSRVIDLKKYTLTHTTQVNTKQLGHYRQASVRVLHRNTLTSTNFSSSGKFSLSCPESMAGRRDLLTALRTHTLSTNTLSSRKTNRISWGDFITNEPEAPEEEKDAVAEPEIQCHTLKHGKARLIFCNNTSFSGFVDLFVTFERWAEFSAPTYPTQLTVSEFMHYIPRGLRSNFIRSCVPKPPSTIPTKGIFVRHAFDLSYKAFRDPHAISVIQEVHRYSLEDHNGLLISVSNGGTAYDSSFLSITAAITSSICFFQRVLMRLGNDIALSMRCSITDAPLHISTYQVQYNDANNIHSAYPDVQFVGPAIYYSSHPSIVPPTLYAFEQELPRTVVKQKRNTSSVLNFDPFELSEAERERELLLYAPKTKFTMVRFEIRSVASTTTNPELSSSSVILRGIARSSSFSSSNRCNGESPSNSRLHEPDSKNNIDLNSLVVTAIEDHISLTMEDKVLPYFLSYLCEHLKGTMIVKEPHALVILVPLAVLQASMQLPALLTSACYRKPSPGPF